MHACFESIAIKLAGEMNKQTKKKHEQTNSMKVQIERKEIENKVHEPRVKLDKRDSKKKKNATAIFTNFHKT